MYLFNHKASDLMSVPLFSVLGQPLPQARALQHTHVPPVLQGGGQYTHSVICVCDMYMHSICKTANRSRPHLHMQKAHEYEA